MKKIKDCDTQMRKLKDCEINTFVELIMGAAESFSEIIRKNEKFPLKTDDVL
jgi:hypothetical protein